jgi:hypothetical protein
MNQESGEPLVAANIQIAGSYRGTISNADGKFGIELQHIPDTLMISYIGYETQRVVIAEIPDHELNIFLKPILLEADPIIVIAEDPAIEIMRKVIRRKKIWREALKTYQANAYSRLVLENDSGIVSIAESISETFWDRLKGSREVIKSKKQTSNLSEEENLAIASYIPNFYDDDIDEMGFKVIGPTHPDALKYYDFKLETIRYLDDKDVYSIRVLPTTKLQPVFEGTLEVLDSTFSLLAVNLKPGSSILYPWPIKEWNLSYQQQFSNFGKIFWLPVDYRVKGSIKIGLTGLHFPTIYYERITGLTGYRINVDLPDSLYEQENFLLVDSIALKDQTLAAEHQAIIPLTRREEMAYQSLDSTMTLNKAFKPTGFLAKMIDVEVEGERNEKRKKSRSLFTDISPQLWFNRVDGVHAGISYNPGLSNRLKITLAAAYKTDLRRGSFATGLEYRILAKLPARFKVVYSTNSELCGGGSETYSRTIASLTSLLAAPDYFDYYWNKSILFESFLPVYHFNTIITVRIKSEEHSSLSKQNDFNLIGSGYKQRINPDIESGRLRSLELQIRYGNDYLPFGMVAQKRLEVGVEHSSPGLFSSDYDYTRFTLAADFRLNTFLKRRLLPMALDIHLAAGAARGDLPVQKLYTIDGRMLGFSPFAVLRTLSSRPYQGEKFAAIFIEHNFRTMVFELLDWEFLVRNGVGIIVHGAAGRSWISRQKLQMLLPELHYSDQLHQEIGISLNGLFNMFRLDITQRLDRKSTFIGFGLSRFF